MEVTMCTGTAGETKKQLAHVSINDASQTKQILYIYIVWSGKKKTEFQFDQCCWSFVQERQKIHTICSWCFCSTRPWCCWCCFFCLAQKNTALICFSVFFRRRPTPSYQMAVVVIRIGCHFCSISRKQMPPPQQRQQQQ